MKKYIHLSLLLFIIASISGLILSVVYSKTLPYIEAQQEKKIASNLVVLYPEYASNKIIGENVDNKFSQIREIYSDAEQTNLIGYVFVLYAPGSYSGKLQILVALDKNGEVVGHSYLNMPETPGVGARTKTDVNFNNQFIGADITTIDQMDTLTGATISSKSIRNGIKLALEYYNAKLKTSEVGINE